MIRDSFRYVPISPRTKSWGLFVTGGGHIEIPPHGSHPPEGHPNLYEFTWDRGRVLPEFQIILVETGAGLFESDGVGLRELRAGEAVVLFPGVWHRYRPQPETGWSSYWIGLGGGFMESLLDHGFLSRESPVVVPQEEVALKDAFQNFHTAITADSFVNPLLLSARAMEILASVCAPDGPDTAEPSTAPFQEGVHDRIVAEALRIIWSRDDASLNVADVAALLPLSRRSLERRFQQALGRTILGEINRCRIERVKGLLAETDLPLKQLARRVGFSSAETLAKAFQRQVGETPSAYRKECRQRETDGGNGMLQ